MKFANILHEYAVVGLGMTAKHYNYRRNIVGSKLSLSS